MPVETCSSIQCNWPLVSAGTRTAIKCCFSENIHYGLVKDIWCVCTTGAASQSVNSCCKLEEGLLEGTFQSISMVCCVFSAASGAGAVPKPAALQGGSAERLRGALAAQPQQSELFTTNKASDEFGLILPSGNILQHTTVSSKISHCSISFHDSK